MHCAACRQEMCGPDEAFTGDVCPRCAHFAHPTRLGDYENLELIKRGGMGAVYRAAHPKVGTTVAIKVVHQNQGPEGLAERFDREAKLAARIPHPGAVRVFDVDSQEGRLYLVMEYIDGPTLRQAAQDGPREIGWCIDKVAQLADVLEAAHGVGIVHRDVKPENVIVDRTGRVRVLDFGISRLLDDGERLTRTGEILGTPEYIAPEQILDVPEAVDARTDVYACGVVLYELLTGRSPFAGSNLLQVLRYVESRTPPVPSHHRAEIPAELDELVMAAIAKDKKRRPASCRDFAQRLRAIAPAAAAPPPRAPEATAVARRAGWSWSEVRSWVGFSVVVAVCLGAGWILGGMVSPRDETPVAEPATPAADPPSLVEVCGDELVVACLLDRVPWLAAGFDAEDRWGAHTEPVVASLGHHLAGRALDAAQELNRAAAGAAPDVASVLMRAALGPVDARVTVLREVAAEADRLEPLRYQLELAAAILAGELPRLRAAAELAAVAGDADRATAIYLAGRVALASEEVPIPPRTAVELLAFADTVDIGRGPGLDATRLALALAAGDRARAAKLLAAIRAVDDPALAFLAQGDFTTFAHFRDAAAEARR